MRKYQQFSQGRLKTRIPTIVVMCVALFSILYFGPSLSAGVANFFVPNVPVPDAVSVSEGERGGAYVPAEGGAVMASASRNAARTLLSILSKGRPHDPVKSPMD